MPSITVDDVLARRPCSHYPETRVRKLWQGLGKRATAKRLYDHLVGRIPNCDLLWLLLSKPLISDRALRLFGCDCAARVLRREAQAGRKPDKRSYAAVRIARRFAMGSASGQELTAAYAAAAATAAAYDTAAAAENSERAWQIRRLKRYL